MPGMTPEERTHRIVAQAQALGFDLCGVAPAAKFPEMENLSEWLARGYAGEMKYLHNPKRQSPELALEGARSVIVCAMNYNTALPFSTEARAGLQLETASVEPRSRAARKAGGSRAPALQRGWISRYAWGDDYHEVLGNRLQELVAWMRREFAEPHEARWYVDTGPIVERVAAKWAGLGWLAKNTCLINKDWGSWLFLGVVITTLDLEPSLTSDVGASFSWPDAGGEAHTGGQLKLAPTSGVEHVTPLPDLCGQCTLCIEACPTGALVEPYVLDARRCISYLTIELRGPIPNQFHNAIGWHIFGCDICQDVCPYNRRAPVTDKPEFQPRHFKSVKSETETERSGASLFAPSLESVASLDEAGFAAQFAGSAVRRTKWQGFTRNVELVREANKGSSGPD